MPRMVDDQRRKLWDLGRYSSRRSEGSGSSTADRLLTPAELAARLDEIRGP